MTKIKICGIKTLTDALAAIQAGADYLGFNFYPKSLRFVEKSACAEIVSVLQREHPQIKLVGVFVNASAEEIQATMEACGLSLAQLHGDESVEILKRLDGKAFKAFRGIPESVDEFARNQPPAFLLDASVKGVYGGSGVTTDWDKAAELANKYPFFLAGGLTPENVAEAIRRVKPWGVDVASGVESAPGKKDAKKMARFVREVKRVEIGK